MAEIEITFLFRKSNKIRKHSHTNNNNIQSSSNNATRNSIEITPNEGNRIATTQHKTAQLSGRCGIEKEL
jgi:hypothetical protein